MVIGSHNEARQVQIRVGAFDALLDAAGAAAMIAATQIANSTVDGVEGAFALPGGDMTLVNVLSGAGPASAITTGSMASATLTAGTDASAITGGDLSTSTLTATESAGLVAGVSVLSTTIHTGSDAVVPGLAGVALSQLDAGGDATLYALGDLSANAIVGGTLWAAADGALSGDYTVEDDIVGLWARSDITGTYVSHDNVQSVISNGGISASITAGGLANPDDADGDGYGRIVLVRAWNDVAGTLTADESIDEVVAGGLVTATLNAQVIGSVGENEGGVGHLCRLGWRICGDRCPGRCPRGAVRRLGGLRRQRRRRQRPDEHGRGSFGLRLR